MKIVFVGQQPNSYEDEGVALPIRPGSSGQRLVTMMGVTPDAFESAFIRINVSPYHDPEGFSPEYHHTSASNLLPLLEGRRVILLGPAVAKAFKLERSAYEWCKFFDHPSENVSCLMAVIPHPSGLNRLYNDPEIQQRVSQLLDYAWRTRDGERHTEISEEDAS